MPQLLSIQLGQSVTYPGDDSKNNMSRTWSSSFYKSPVNHPVQINELGIVGDSVTDHKVHGGIDKAILAYSSDHFAKWKEEIGIELTPGGFGENFTISDLTENDVCLGDQWQIGDVILEVSQPRQPCWKLARRHMLAELPKLVIQSNRSGWYLRVTQSGIIQAPSPIKLIHHPSPDWTISRVNNVYYSKTKSQNELQELADLPTLSSSWRDDFLRMLELK